MNLSQEAVAAFYAEQENILVDEVVKTAGLMSGAKRLFGKFVPKSRAGRIGLGVGAAGVGAAGGAFAYNRRGRKSAPGKKVGNVPASAKRNSMFQKIVEKVKQRFPEIPGRNIPWLVYLAMKERGLLK